MGDTSGMVEAEKNAHGSRRWRVASPGARQLGLRCPEHRGLCPAAPGAFSPAKASAGPWPEVGPAHPEDRGPGGPRPP